LDAHDQAAVEAHADEVVAKAGSIDISFNAISINAVQNIPLVDMALGDFMTPITEATRTHYRRLPGVRRSRSDDRCGRESHLRRHRGLT
jgi:hypothetical protein